MDGQLAPGVIQAHDLRFKPYISATRVARRVTEIGLEIAERHPGEIPIFLCVLNGSVIFSSDLIRACPLESEISFVRLSSYEGTRSSGNLIKVLGLQEEVKDRLVIVVEDIIDSGNTLNQFLPMLWEKGPSNVEVATLLFKPEALRHELPIDYVGFEIPNRFVIGYGLDYRGLGRGLPDIYQLVEES